MNENLIYGGKPPFIYFFKEEGKNYIIRYIENEWIEYAFSEKELHLNIKSINLLEIINPHSLLTHPSQNLREKAKKIINVKSNFTFENDR